jgi:TolB-like protein/Flp pilus assembly protein TadD
VSGEVLTELSVALAERYVIERELGRGGMATVYLARDLRHARNVALKVLDPELGAVLGGERFRREIETTSALRHPNILPLYDSGTAGDLLFYVMPLVEGESLRARLDREKQLPLDDALRIAHEVCSALDYAHTRGVVHRDIKPDNILLEHGHAMVADFGIARATASVGTEALTATGLSIGTPAYMSPEQAAGTRAIDGRSDQYALGCVIFEMLAGQAPFTGPTAASLVHQHMVLDPPLLTHLRAGVPLGIATVVQRALAKDPADRFSSMNEFSTALEQGASGPVGRTALGTRRIRRRLVAATGTIAALCLAAAAWYRVSRANPPADGARAGTASAGVQPIPDMTQDPSVAVLPLANLSGDASQEFFSDGISEEIANVLGKVPGLRVIARTSAFSFKGKTATIPEIARALHVAAVLDGSVQRSGDRVRINVRLVRASDQSEVWTERYDRTLDDIFKVQDDIASSVAKALRVTLLGSAQPAHVADPRAYALSLQGNFLVRQGTRESRARAVANFRQALAIDPRDGQAWTGLAGAYISQASNSERAPSEGRRLAREAINSALAADPHDATALSVRGWIEMTYDNDFVSAARDFHEALDHSPNPGVVGNAAMFVQNLGHLDEAIRATLYQFAHDPANPRVPYNLATIYYFAHRWDDAIAAARTALALSPGRTSLHATIAVALVRKGDTSAALREAMAEPGEQFRLPALAMVYHTMGRSAQSDSAAAAFATKFGTDDPYTAASVYAFRGDANVAFQWLERAAAQSDLANVAVDPAFDPIHRDARWLPFLRKAGKAPEQLAAIPFKLTMPR